MSENTQSKATSADEMKTVLRVANGIAHRIREKSGARR